MVDNIHETRTKPSRMSRTVFVVNTVAVSGRAPRRSPRDCTNSADQPFGGRELGRHGQVRRGVQHARRVAVGATEHSAQVQDPGKRAEDRVEQVGVGKGTAKQCCSATSAAWPRRT